MACQRGRIFALGRAGFTVRSRVTGGNEWACRFMRLFGATLSLLGRTSNVTLVTGYRWATPAPRYGLKCEPCRIRPGGHSLFLYVFVSLSLVTARIKSAVRIACRTTAGHRSIPVKPPEKPTQARYRVTAAL